MVSSDIRNKFIEMYKAKEFNNSGLLEILGASFIADKNAIFGVPNDDYILKEIRWYNSKSLNIYDMHNPPGVWKDIADDKGYINSNYGWCIFSKDNYNQYKKVLDKLRANKNTRQGCMIYTRPTMHEDSVKDGRYDFMCTNAVTYFIKGDKINCVVQMRSNDIVYGYKNDYAWQYYVLGLLAQDLNLNIGDIHWQVASLHMYPRHFKLIDKILENDD